MLTSLFRSRNQQEIRRLFQGRMNRKYSQQIRFGKRVAPRANHSEVVWVIPYDAAIGRPDFSRVAPMVTKDCSCEGMSLIHDEPVTSERVLVGLPGDGVPVEKEAFGVFYTG